MRAVFGPADVYLNRIGIRPELPGRSGIQRTAKSVTPIHEFLRLTE